MKPMVTQPVLLDDTGVAIADAINNLADVISGGGGSDPAPDVLVPLDVNFYDWDGTLLYAYTKDEFLALNGLPEPPTHEGWTSEGWSFPSEELPLFIQYFGSMQIGALYSTPDTTIKIVIPDDGNLNIQLNYEVAGNNASTGIDWGDGSDVEYYANGTLIQHDYDAPGEYTITLITNSGKVYLGGDAYDGEDHSLMMTDSTQLNPTAIQNYVKEVVIGSNVAQISNYCFRNFEMLQKVMISPSVMRVFDEAFNMCISLRALVIPPSVNQFGTDIVKNCISMQTYIPALSM